MTTLTLTIGGVNFLPQYRTGSAKITDVLKNQGNTLEVVITQKSTQNPPAVGKEIILKDATRFLFGGFITKITPVEYGIGQLIVYTVEAHDYTYILTNKYAQASYTNQTLSAIVADLLANNVNAGYGLSSAFVATGPIVATLNLNHISLRQAFENLAKITGYIWWIDYQKNIHFIDPTTATVVAPEKITDSTGNHEDMAISQDLTQVRNDIIVIGGTQESSQYTQIILGNANAREWVLLYPVQAMGVVELSIAGAAYNTVSFGVDPKDDETLFYSMYSPDRGSIRLSSGSTTIGATDKLRVKFTYPLPVLTEVKSAASIAAMKALEGGDGIHSYTIQDTTIVSQSQAQQRALKELNQFANPILTGQFRTRTGLLLAGTFFSAGQSVTVNLPSWGISVDTTYVVQKVVMTLDESVSQIEYHYDVTFGGNLLGVVDFLQALASPEQPLDTSGQVQKIQAIAEIMTTSEVITRNGNVRTLSESMTFSESLSTVNVTPPFKWAPFGTASKGRWGESEWG